MSIELPAQPGAQPTKRRREPVSPRPLRLSESQSPYGVFRSLQRQKRSYTIGIGVLGYGYWGPNLVRNFAERDHARVIAVSDLSVERLAEVHARYPTVKLTTDYRDLLADPAIDAIVIATPVKTHFELAERALLAGKHVLVTKPMTADPNQAIELIEAAEQRGLVLMVDHTFIYTGAVQTIKQLLDSGNLGQLYYYDSVRVNLGLFQSDVNVLWDLAVHDLAIMDYVLGQSPVAVTATGAAHIPGQRVNLAYLTCYFDGSLISHHHVNWLAPLKIRRTLIGGSRQMIVYDDLEPSEKIKVYDKGITLASDTEGTIERLVGYRTGDMFAPQVSLAEGLKTESQHFIECIAHRRQPLTDGHCGLRITRVLEGAARSLAQRGRPVELRRTEGGGLNGSLGLIPESA